MGAMTGQQLRTRLESTMSVLIEKKCEYLKVGKNVKEINKRLKAAYNWWVITDQCTLTDAQINCIVNDVKAVCGFISPTKIESNVPEVVTPEPRYKDLTIYFTVADDCVFSEKGDITFGQINLQGLVSGGSGGYSFEWSCVWASRAAVYEQGTPPTTGEVTFSSISTQNTTVGNLRFKAAYKFRFKVTDSVGNEKTVELFYEDGRCVVFSKQESYA